MKTKDLIIINIFTSLIWLLISFVNYSTNKEIVIELIGEHNFFTYCIIIFISSYIIVFFMEVIFGIIILLHYLMIKMYKLFDYENNT